MQPVIDQRPPLVRTFWWWAVTLLVLVVLDDLTFGPAFWFLSRTLGAGVAVVAVYAVYVPVQIWLVRRGTSEHPGAVARWFLDRLQLARRFPEVQRNEMALHEKVAGGGTAVVLSLVIGGVLPPLLLWRRGWPTSRVRSLSVLTAVIYATEFAVLHGLVPSLI